MANSSNRDAYFFISYVYIHPTAKQYANKGNAIRPTISGFFILTCTLIFTGITGKPQTLFRESYSPEL